VKARRLQEAVTNNPAEGCNVACAAHTSGGFSTTADCKGSVNAGKGASCAVSSADTAVPPLLSKCMPVFAVKCPANNADATTQPFIIITKDANTGEFFKPMKCQACSSVPLTDTSDMDPEAGKYWVNLQWGRNAMGDAYDEGSISGYEIHIVDAKGVAVENTKVRMPAKDFSGASACCNPSVYSLAVSGTWPATGVAFMIVPYQLIMGGVAVGQYVLPFGTMTLPLVDVTSGTMQTVEGVATFSGMSQAGATQLFQNPSRDVILTNGIVASDVEKKITAGNVRITSVKIKNPTRRLAQGEKRRLADNYGLDVGYKLLLPEGYVFTATSLNTTKMKSTIEQ